LLPSLAKPRDDNISKGYTEKTETVPSQKGSHLKIVENQWQRTENSPLRTKTYSPTNEIKEENYDEVPTRLNN